MFIALLPSSRALPIMIAFFIWQADTFAQRSFIKSINGSNRSYLLHSTNPVGYSSVNSSLVIILHSCTETARDAYQTALLYPREGNYVMIFPNSEDGWSCQEEYLNDNRQFLGKVVDDTYANFHIDRNKVYIFGDIGSGCFLDSLRDYYQSFNLSVNLMRSSDFNPFLIANHADSLKSERHFPLWTDLFAPKKMSAIDSLRGYRFHKRWVADFQIGVGAVLPSSKTGINDGTYMDLGKAKSFMALRVSKWFNDSVAGFVDVGWLKVPRKMELDGDRVKVGGGMIVPLTVGGKYAIYRTSFFYPYVALGGGMVFVMATGGRFNPRTLASGAANLNYGQRYAPQITLSCGLDMRMSKRITIGGQLRYLHSLKFSTLGNLDSIRGFNFTGTLGYVINANSLRGTGFK